MEGALALDCLAWAVSHGLGCGSKSHTPWLMGQWGPRGERQRFSTEERAKATDQGTSLSVEGWGRRARLAGLEGLPGLCSQTLPGSRAQFRTWRRRSSGSCGGAPPSPVPGPSCPAQLPYPALAPPALLPILLPPCRLGAPAPSHYKVSRSCVSSTSERPSEALALL